MIRCNVFEYKIMIILYLINFFRVTKKTIKINFEHTFGIIFDRVIACTRRLRLVCAFKEIYFPSRQYINIDKSQSNYASQRQFRNSRIENRYLAE